MVPFAEEKQIFDSYVPYKIAPMNASPAPVVSTSSEPGIFSAVPKNSLPQTVPTPLACNLVMS